MFPVIFGRKLEVVECQTVPLFFSRRSEARKEKDVSVDTVHRVFLCFSVVKTFLPLGVFQFVSRLVGTAKNLGPFKVLKRKR